MSIGETRGGKDQRFMQSWASTVPDIAEALKGLKSEIDLSPELWGLLERHLAARAVIGNAPRLNDAFGKAVARVEQAALEFEAALIALDRTRDGKMMLRKAGRETLDTDEFWDVLSRFQSIAKDQTFEANPADFYRSTIKLVCEALPDCGPTELTKVLEKMEAALPGLIFPPDTMQHARRDYVRNVIRSIG